MTKLEYILDFSKEYGKQMLASGSNIERVGLVMERICHAYGLHDVTSTNLSSRIFISAKDENGNYCDRQTHVPPATINLERIKKLNKLGSDIIENTPEPEHLRDLLDGVVTNDFPWWFILIGFIVAMSALCRTFLGQVPELILTIAHTLMMFGLSKLFAKIALNKIITNFIMMFLCCVSAMLFYKAGLINYFFVVVITNAFFLIPGIPLVNSVRNLLCGNEQNGIIELIKVLLEGLSIVAGVAAAYALLGNYVGNPLIENSMPTYEGNMLLRNIELTVLTLLACGGFSITFNIQLKDIIFAALGGAIVRIVLILTSLVLPEYRFLYMTCAAFAAALYSEILGNIRKEPSTLFLYPAIVPLIPGDLLYYFALGLIWQNPTLASTYGPDLLLTLVGISLGFVVCSSAVHYFRKFRFFNFIKRKISSK